MLTEVMGTLIVSWTQPTCMTSYDLCYSRKPVPAAVNTTLLTLVARNIPMAEDVVLVHHTIWVTDPFVL